MAPTPRVVRIITPWSRDRGDGVTTLRGVDTVATTYVDAPPPAEVWRSADAVIVDLFDDGRPHDRVVGIGVVELLGATADHAGPTVVVVADRAVDPLVRLRLIEAGVDALCAQRDLRGLAPRLAGDRRTIADEWHPQVTPGELFRHGLTPRSRMSAGLSYVVREGLATAFARSDAAGGLSRRRAITVRTELSRVLEAHATASGTGAVVARSVPSWNQLRGLIRAAWGWAD